MPWHECLHICQSNKNDFSICLKVRSVTARSQSAEGRAFQYARPEMLKAADQGWLSVSVEWAVDSHPMITAENDHQPLQCAHKDGSGCQVPNHKDKCNSTGTTCTMYRVGQKKPNCFWGHITLQQLTIERRVILTTNDYRPTTVTVYQVAHLLDTGCLRLAICIRDMDTTRCWC